MWHLRIAPCGSLFITPISPPSRPGLLPLWHLRREGVKRKGGEQSHSKQHKPDSLLDKLGTKTVSRQPYPRVGFLLFYSTPFHNKDSLWSCNSEFTDLSHTEFFRLVKEMHGNFDFVWGLKTVKMSCLQHSISYQKCFSQCFFFFTCFIRPLWKSVCL